MTHPAQALLDKIKADNRPDAIIPISPEELALLPSVSAQSQPIFTAEQEQRIREIMREEADARHS